MLDLTGLSVQSHKNALTSDANCKSQSLCTSAWLGYKSEDCYHTHDFQDWEFVRATHSLMKMLCLLLVYSNTNE